MNISVKRISILICFVFSSMVLLAQTESGKKERKLQRKEEKRQRTNSIVKQEEEGVLTYNKQTSFGLQLRTNGYGAFLELGRMRTPRFTNLYSLEISEIHHPKEEKVSTETQSYFGGSFKYAKINNFYQAKLGFGQQYIFGQKGNKNGVAVLGIYQGGLSVGLLKPYYLDIRTATGEERSIKYTTEDSAAFLNQSQNSVIVGSSGMGKGWSEVKIRPGAFLKTALRFDFGSYNESITALEIGMSLDAYAQKIEQMVGSKPQRLYFQGHIAIVFGSRK